MSDALDEAPNGRCPKCRSPFPMSRKRCWKCSPGGNGRKSASDVKDSLDGFDLIDCRPAEPAPVVLAPNDNDAPARHTVADFLKGSVVSAFDPSSDTDVNATVRKALEDAERHAKVKRLAEGTLPHEERTDLIRQIHADRARAEREQVKAEREAAMRGSGIPRPSEPVRPEPRPLPEIQPRPKADPRPPAEMPRPRVVDLDSMVTPRKVDLLENGPVIGAADSPAAVVVSTEDLEMATLLAVVDALKKLEPSARRRVLGYVNDRFATPGL